MEGEKDAIVFGEGTPLVNPKRANELWHEAVKTDDVTFGAEPIPDPTFWVTYVLYCDFCFWKPTLGGYQTEDPHCPTTMGYREWHAIFLDPAKTEMQDWLLEAAFK